MSYPLMLVTQTKAHIGLPTQASETQYDARGKNVLDLSRCNDFRISLYLLFIHLQYRMQNIPILYICVLLTSLLMLFFRGVCVYILHTFYATLGIIITVNMI